MEAKEKAKELVDNYKEFVSWGMFNDFEDRDKNAKECALICVDEKIETVKKLASNEGTDWGELEYLQQIKQEILNL